MNLSKGYTTPPRCCQIKLSFSNKEKVHAIVNINIGIQKQQINSFIDKYKKFIKIYEKSDNEIKKIVLLNFQQ